MDGEFTEAQIIKMVSGVIALKEKFEKAISMEALIASQNKELEDLEKRQDALEAALKDRKSKLTQMMSDHNAKIDETKKAADGQSASILAQAEKSKAMASRLVIDARAEADRIVAEAKAVIIEKTSQEIANLAAAKEQTVAAQRERDSVKAELTAAKNQLLQINTALDQIASRGRKVA